MSLTFVNQVGAQGGLNQAAPGSFIPEEFVRWAQDALFDRVGYIRRRAPFDLFPLYSNDPVPTVSNASTTNERIVTLSSTLNPNGDRVTALVLATDNPAATRALLYNEEFRNTGYSPLEYIPRDTIFDCKQASNGGMWLSFLESYKPASGANEYYQYYWYGGAGTEHTVQNTRFGCKHTNNVNHRTFTNKIYAPQFTVTKSAKTSGVVTLTFASHTMQQGDTILVEMSDANFDGTFVITAVTATTVTYNFAGANVPEAADTGTVTQKFNTSILTPGMFVLVEYSGQDYYTGMIKSLDDFEITLEKDAIRWRYSEPVANMGSSVTGTNPNERLLGIKIKFRNFRPYIHVHGRGLITRDSASATGITSGVVGTEGEGHFQSADLAGVTGGLRWGIYRASDNEWIGDIATASNNTTITLESDQHTNETDVILRADEYVCWPYEPIPSPIVNDESSTKFAGVFNATYAGYQWYGNAGNAVDKNRIVFSAYHHAEAVDLSKDAADSILIPGISEMRGMAASTAGLLVFTADKTFIVRGNYRANFSLEELYPEGCLSSMSIVEYGGGVFWASRIGILYYDGASVRNLTESNLGVYYTDSVRTFDVNADRIYSFLHKDYLFVHFNAFDSVFKPARYEPVYADGIETTPAVSNFEADDWDPDFTPDDFLVENNVPIYWDSIKMYESIAANTTRVAAVWEAGYSFSTASMTNGSTTLNGLSYTGVYNGVPYTIDTADITVGDIILGPGIPANTTVFSITDSDTIVMNNPATATQTTTIQIVPATPNYRWSDDPETQFVWGPIQKSEGITFAIYLPTNAITTLSNFGFRGATKIDAISGIKAIMGVNVVNPTGLADGVYPRVVDVDSILQTSNRQDTSVDAELIENTGKEEATYIKGPDFYLQTKHFTVGDPVLRKWFRQVMLNLYLLDGGLRMDIVDMEDNDRIDITRKMHKNWEVFEEAGYTWNEWETLSLPRILSPNRSTWLNVQNLNLTWYEISDAEFTRRKKKISWRYPSVGFRLYQMNKYRPSNYQEPQRPHTVMIDSWNIGFKPMRASRV